MINSFVIYNISGYESIKIMKNLKIIIIISFLSPLIATSGNYCDVCDEKINSEYLQDAWGNKFHLEHQENGVYCNTCSRIICKKITGGGFQFEDGRNICKLCSHSMINNNEDKQKIESINNVLLLLSENGIIIDDQNISINLVDRENLRKHTFSLSKHSKETIKAYTFFNNRNYEINILWGLNQIEFEAVLAHEFLHVWVDHNNLKINNEKLEGFCNLGSSMVYKSYDLKLAKVLQKSIENNEDPTYGKGYKYMNSLLEYHGWENLISMILDNNQN